MLIKYSLAIQELVNDSEIKNLLTEDHAKLSESAVPRNYPKFSDRLIGANSADPDQTAPRGAV